MTHRKPLVPRNREIGRESGKPARKERYRFALLDRSALVEQLNVILGQMDTSLPRTVLVEEDVIHTTALKISHVYYSCFVEIYGVSPDLSIQPSLVENYHPELMDDFAGKVQFFRLMKVLMENCAVPDIRLSDIIQPEAKRTCRNLSALLNFIKFHVHMARQDQEQVEAKTKEMVEYTREAQCNQELKLKLASLQLQKEEEHEHEEELRRILNGQEHQLQSYHDQEISLQQHLERFTEQIQKEKQKKQLLENGLVKVSQRADDLRKQIVSSPNKLRDRLHKLHQEVEEIKIGTQDSDSLKRMWESLATRAQQIPNVMKGLNEDMEILTMKTNKSGEQSHLIENIEESISRRKQTLKEFSSKYQNLIRHLKLVEKELKQVSYDDQQLMISQPKTELERHILQLKTQLHSVEAADELFEREIDQSKAFLKAKTQHHQETLLNIQKEISSLVSAVESHVQTGTFYLVL